jgi:hypothetical protein
VDDTYALRGPLRNEFSDVGVVRGAFEVADIKTEFSLLFGKGLHRSAVQDELLFVKGVLTEVEVFFYEVDGAGLI